MADILLVDDEQSILNALKRIFRKRDFDVRTALGGQEALAMLEERKADVIISDMRMPEMDGAEFLARAREQYPLTERILLTGFSDIASTVKAINDGGIFGYISKPWDNEQVLSLVDSAMERRKKNTLKNRALHSYKRKQEALSLDVERKEREMAQNAAFVDFAHKQLEARQAEQNKQLEWTEQVVDQVHQELKDSYTVTEHVLINLLDLRNKGQRIFGQHVVKVVDHLAEVLSFDGDNRSILLSAARLHGLGRIGLPDSILNQPLNKLSEDERLVYQAYPETGACTLMAIPTYQQVAEIVIQQKEYCDGSGFPRGLRKDEISLHAKVLTVSLDYVELRTGLATGARMSHEQAISVMQAHAPRYGENLLPTLTTITLEVEGLESDTEIMLPVMSLRQGMVLQRDIVSESGVLLLRSGCVLSDSSIDHLANLEANLGERINVSVRLPEQN